MNKDKIYSSSLAKIADFRFDAHVADVFTDMIERSVPGYRAIVTMIETLTARYAQPNSTLYDLGCSLGAATLSMRRAAAPGCHIIAIDNSPAMVERCRNNMVRDPLTTPVEIRCADILETEFTDASVVALNFTLQFIPPAEREALLKRICDGLRPGGALILSEKVVFADAQLDEVLRDIHHDFKRAHGYSNLEISQKRTAIEKVLIPETISAHRERLQQAGFTSVDVWFQCFNFMSMLAIK